MLIKKWIAAAAIASVPFAALAQPANQRPHPLDANAPVSAPAYESAIRNYQAAADEKVSPDKAWRAANEEVGKLGGHMGHVRSGAATAAMPPAAPTGHGKHH